VVEEVEPRGNDDLGNLVLLPPNVPLLGLNGRDKREDIGKRRSESFSNLLRGRKRLSFLLSREGRRYQRSKDISAGKAQSAQDPEYAFVCPLLSFSPQALVYAFYDDFELLIFI